MTRSPHNRALDVAARRYLAFAVHAGRPPKPGDPHDPDWPDWAAPTLEAIADRARQLAAANSPDNPTFLAALHRLTADHHDQQ